MELMKYLTTHIKHSNLNENYIIYFEPSDEELKKIEVEIDNLIDE